MTKTLNLKTVTLHKGAHSPDSTFCVMELAAYLAGEPWSDQPKCVSPVIAAFLRSWNDRLDDTDRQMLKRYSVTSLGTRTTAADEETRSWMAVDWLTQTFAPAFLRLTPSLVEHADALAALPELIDAASANAAKKALAAAGDAARDAARDAAGDAAWDAAAAAAQKRLVPTVRQMQRSACELLDRMIAVGKHEVPIAVKVTGLCAVRR